MSCLLFFWGSKSKNKTKTNSLNAQPLSQLRGLLVVAHSWAHFTFLGLIRLRLNDSIVFAGQAPVCRLSRPISMPLFLEPEQFPIRPDASN